MISCGKKQRDLKQAQQPASIEVEPVFLSEMIPLPQEESSDLYLPPSGPYRPSVEQIQTALKNAGYYDGEIDGKLGPLTKKAIRDFQAANKLKVDSKVGPMTWKILSRYLNPPSQANSKNQ